MRYRTITGACWRLLPSLAVVVALGAHGSSHPPSLDRFMTHVRFLASSELQGRGNGTPELERAAEYIAAEFNSYGLQPGNRGSYFQEFTITDTAAFGTASTVSRARNVVAAI